MDSWYVIQQLKGNTIIICREMLFAFTPPQPYSLESSWFRLCLFVIGKLESAL